MLVWRIRGDAGGAVAVLTAPSWGLVRTAAHAAPGAMWNCRWGFGSVVNSRYIVIALLLFEGAVLHTTPIAWWPGCWTRRVEALARQGGWTGGQFSWCSGLASPPGFSRRKGSGEEGRGNGGDGGD